MTRLLILAALALACAVSTAFAMGHMDLPAGYPPSSSYADGAIIGIVGALVFVLVAMLSRTARATAVMACLSMLLLSGVALAAEVVPATTVILPYGEWVVAAGNTLSAVLLPALAGFLIQAVTKVYPWAALFLTQKRVEQMANAVTEYAINAIPSAVKEGKMSVDVGSKVIAEGVQYAIDWAPKKAFDAAGGAEGLARIIFRKLNLEDGANEANTLSPVLKDIGAVK